MSEEIIPGVWRVGGGTWFMKSVPLASLPHDCNVFLVTLAGGYALVDCASVAGMHAIRINIAKVASNALVVGSDAESSVGVTPEPSRLGDLLLTHTHADHSEAADLWRSWHGLRTHLSEVGADYLSRGDLTLFGADAAPHQQRPFEVDHVVKDGAEFEVAGTTFTAITVPGHTPDLIMYMTELKGKKVAFSGDVCFGPADWDPNPGNIGRVWELYKSNLLDYRNTLLRMLALEIDVLIPGHGECMLGAKTVNENLTGSLTTIEQFLETPRIYAFGVPWA